MQQIIISPNSFLYRFIPLSPNEISTEFFESKHPENNRFNDVNCFCFSVDDIRLELGYDNVLRGSILSGIVQEPLTIIYSTEEYEFNLIKAINDGGNHNTKLLNAIKNKLPYYRVSSYEVTQKYADKWLQSEGIDGIGYSSAQGVNIMNKGILYYMGNYDSPSPYIQNIGLTRKGFSKLKVQPPVPFWTTDEDNRHKSVV